MALEDRKSWVQGRAETAAVVDQGLRSYMLKVYNYMASGVLLSGIMALMVQAGPLRPLFFQQIAGAPPGVAGPTPLMWGAVIGVLIMGFVLPMGINRMKATTAQALFWVYAALMGVMLSSVLEAYTGASVARVFFITTASFAGLSLYGYTTKRDLSAFGRFLVMGMIGLLIAIVVNMFMASDTLSFVISVVGVLIFAGLTAWDTQKIKEMYLDDDHPEIAKKKAVMGALMLYIDFVGLFIHLIHLLGNRE
jgi:FtsH-binding integral membrane protein